MAPDFTAKDALLLYRERIVELLAAHGITRPRVAGLVAAGRPVPPGVPVELYVTMAGAHDWYSVDVKRIDSEIGELIGHPVLLVHRAGGGQDDGWPGEEVWEL